MMMSLVGPETVAFPELDTIALNVINRADVNAVGTDDIHVVLDPVRHHVALLCSYVLLRSNVSPSSSFMAAVLLPLNVKSNRSNDIRRRARPKA
jgi:hypothetical protein